MIMIRDQHDHDDGEKEDGHWPLATLIVNGHCNFRPDIHFLEINVENMYQVGLTFDKKIMINSLLGMLLKGMN